MNNRKDYYKILGLERNASQDDIKKAFRKLSKEYHPDRFVNEPEDKRKEAEERFKDINEANQVLSDTQKKARYDGGGSFSFEDIFGNQNPFGGFNPWESFSGFNPFTNQRKPQGPPKGQDIAHVVNLNLSQLYKGCEIKFKYKRNIRCDKCNGEGGEGVETCPVCNGSGQVTHIHQQGPMTIQQTAPCNHCHGTGKVIKKVCDKCNGSGFKVEEVEQLVNIRKWPSNGERILIRGGGSQSKDPKGQNGDLIIIVKWNIDASKYSIDDRGNVYEQIDIPLIDCVLGTTLDRDLPNEAIIKLLIPKCSGPGTQIVTNQPGVNNRGHYIYIVVPEFPKELTEEQEKILKQLKESK